MTPQPEFDTLLAALPAAPVLEKKTRLKDHAEGRTESFKLHPAKVRPEPGWNGRTEFHGIPALADDLLDNEQSDPCTIRRTEDGHLFLVTGERRWRASVYIVTHIAQDPDQPAARRARAAAFRLRCQLEPQRTTLKNRLFRQLSENSGHEFTLLEKARLYERILAEDGTMTEAEIARRSQTTRQAVNQALTLVRFGAPGLLSLVEQSKLSASLAGEIIAQHKDNPAAQLATAHEALAKAEESGKTKATPKHLAKPTLGFEFLPGTTPTPNAHGVFPTPDRLRLAHFLRSTKLTLFQVSLQPWEGIYCAGHDVELPGSGNFSPCSTTSPLDPTPPTTKDAWALAYWSAAQHLDKVPPVHQKAIELAFFAALDERFPDQEITVTDPHQKEDNSPPWEDKDSEDQEHATGDLFGEDDDSDDDDDGTPPTVEDGTKPRFTLYQIAGAPKDWPERFRLVLENPAAGVKLLHLSWGFPEGPTQPRQYGYSVHLEEDSVTTKHHAPVGDDSLRYLRGAGTATALIELLTLVHRNTRKHPASPSLLELRPQLENIAVAINTGDGVEPEELAWVDPDAVTDAAAPDPGALERIKGADDTNRDGTRVGAGNDGGYVAPDERLKSIENIFEKLAEDPKLNHDRFETAQLVVSYITNLSDGHTLRKRLLSQ